jgi:signal transduction histidine kinase
MGQEHPQQLMQNHAAFLAGEHDFQADIERLSASQLIGTILETVMLATGVRFAGIARVTAERWVACRTVDEVKFGIAEGDEIQIESTFCQRVRDTREMVVFSDATTDPVYCDHPIASAFGIVSYASIPIYRDDGSFFGTLCAIDPASKDVGSSRSVAMLKMFAELIGQTLETEERLEAQEILAEHDRKLLKIQEEFVAILGHDLRNPVAALQAGVRMLGKDPLTDRGRELLVLMRSSLHRMHELVDNMMLHAKSRLGGGISISAKPDAPLMEAISHVVEEIRIASPQHEIVLDLAFSRPVSCDPARVAQAVSNLISNAINYGASERPITVCGRSENNEITIAVSNEGDPIPEEMQRIIFQPFRRGSKKEDSGLGLGLHIASSIADAHNGRLSFSSQNRNTTFTITLPLLASY